MDAKPRRLWPWIVVALIGLPALYVASFGPACWMANRGAVDLRKVADVHEPLVRYANRFPANWMSAAVKWYATIGAWNGTDSTLLVMEAYLYKRDNPDLWQLFGPP